jgi:hypothetical protein
MNAWIHVTLSLIWNPWIHFIVTLSLIWYWGYRVGRAKGRKERELHVR